MINEKLMALMEKRIPKEWSAFYIVTDRGTYQIDIHNYSAAVCPRDAVDELPEELRHREIVEIRADEESLTILLDNDSIIEVGLHYIPAAEASFLGVSFYTKDEWKHWAEEYLGKRVIASKLTKVTSRSSANG